MIESDKTIIRKLSRDLEEAGLHFEGVFGSRAIGTSLPASDYDILYSESESFRKKNLGWDRLYAVDQVKNRLEMKYNIKIDLVSLNALGGIAKKYVLKDRILNV